MKQLGYIGIDQYGNHYSIEKHPRKELIEQIGINHAAKMYVDTKSGKTKEVGYVIGPHWVNVYRICEWKAA